MLIVTIPIPNISLVFMIARKDFNEYLKLLNTRDFEIIMLIFLLSREKY